jgi:molybdopterin/thiamine biosynthesis adenylyltransferase
VEIEIIAELGRRVRMLPGREGEVAVLSPDDLVQVGCSFALSLRQVEILALKGGLLPERYLRNVGTIGREGQRRLLESRVGIIGCGGLGGYVLEGLSRTGVGRLVAVDGDRFVAHNMNRQLLSLTENLGRSKVEVARERIAQTNPAVEVTAHAVAATQETLPSLLAEVDVVVDALDNPRDRLLLQGAAEERRIPLVHGAIAGFVGQVTTVLPGDRTLDLLYGTEDVPDRGVEALLGTPAVTPMLVAAAQVAEVLKLLLGKGDLMRGRLLYIDLETGVFESFPMLDLEE